MDGRATHSPHNTISHTQTHHAPSQASFSAPSPTGRAPWPPPAPLHSLPPGAAPPAAGAAAAAAPPPRRPVCTVKNDRFSRLDTLAIQWSVKRRSIELAHYTPRRSSAARVRSYVRATRGPAESGASGRCRQTSRAAAAASCANRVCQSMDDQPCSGHGVCSATMCLHELCIELYSPMAKQSNAWQHHAAILSIDSKRWKRCVASMPNPYDSPCRPVVMVPSCRAVLLAGGSSCSSPVVLLTPPCFTAGQGVIAPRLLLVEIERPHTDAGERALGSMNWHNCVSNQTNQSIHL